ncbi:PREDICTED: small nuclear ribonucleoprotein-associated protein B'-like [Erythranthe guttata]|uniref:small nuclear ribonucleoprotein-associated protein B'-like n=1 Tax=Erythranthe guttata TaxID=4155 RepID=UPI00064DB29E|nr:PREDICTED: small nuclear ribonucleoprotein-associated protein B'-like [Erythranthe guttata]|eukprot:XP_012828574.1 PREDICTED: small nuclear ribonucleoprotein-associated protein B'-like [Erythranthe guttata]
MVWQKGKKTATLFLILLFGVTAFAAPCPAADLRPYEEEEETTAAALVAEQIMNSSRKLLETPPRSEGGDDLSVPAPPIGHGKPHKPVFRWPWKKSPPRIKPPPGSRPPWWKPWGRKKPPPAPGSKPPKRPWWKPWGRKKSPPPARHVVGA